MKYWYVLLMLFNSQFLVAQKPTTATNCMVTYQVFDAETQLPLPLAAVWIESLAKGTVTDSLGTAKVSLICGTRHEVQVHFMGYISKRLAMQTVSDTTVAISLSPDDTLLEEVSVQGHKDPAPMNTLSISRIDAQKLELSQGGGLGQSLEQITGVTTLKTGNNIAKPMIHGLHSNRILILNNGIKQEGQQWGAEHAPEIDVFTAEQLSVIKGAATVKYGAEALGGVVLISPPDLPTNPKLAGSLHLLGASNGRMGAVNASLEGGNRKWEGFGWRVQGSTKRSGDMQTPNYWLTNTGVKETGGSLAFGWKRKTWVAEAYYSYYQNTTGLLKATSVLGSLEDLELALTGEKPALTKDRFSYEIGLPRQEVQHHLLKLSGHFHLGSTKFEWTYGAQIDQRQEYDRRLGASLSTRPVIDLQLQNHSLDLALSDWKIGAWKSTIGLNLGYKDNNNLPGTGRIPLIPNYNSLEGGAFGIAQGIFGQWEVEMGLRYDAKYYSVRGRDFRNDLFTEEIVLQNFTATAGATYQIGKYARLNTNIGTAWRAPHVAELYSFGKKQGAAAIEYGLLIGTSNEVEKWDSDNTPNEQGLKWVTTYELRKSLWNFSLTGYLNWIQNYIYIKPQGVTVGVAGPYPYYRQAQTDAFFSGLDMTAQHQLGTKWLWEGTASLIWAKDLDNNDQLPFVPPNQLGTSIQYKIATWKGWKNLYVKTGYQYTTSPNQAPSRIITVSDFIGALHQDKDLLATDSRNFDFMPLPQAYGLIQLSAGAEKLLKQGQMLRLGIDIQNLLNTSYRNYMNRLRYFAEEAGRNSSFSIKYIF